jgi:hypothetical protein
MRDSQTSWHSPRLWLQKHFACLAMLSILASHASAQSVCLPLPRLLSIMPMGGTVGTTVEATIVGENLEEAGDLFFQHPGITAIPKKDAAGHIEPNRYLISIAADTPIGLTEARVMSRLGVSSARVFSVGTHPETVVTTPNGSLANAIPLAVPSVCNAVATAKSVDHYAFEAVAGARYWIHCASRGIDSKLDPVVIVADAAGRDLQVERRGDTLDFTATSSGKHIVKVHELTYKGGPGFFYRLSLEQVAADAPLPQYPSTQFVSAFSWPPSGLPVQASIPEEESADVQTVALPCDLSGRFYPAADVDTFEFSAQSGETWWIEVASERLGRSTDPSMVIQQSQGQGAEQRWVDIAELNDIASPMKPSSNGYAYDGPPFDGGSTDILGKLEVKTSGAYRLVLTDLFGGTRRDPRNGYRLIVRKAQPDFAVVAWGLHMELRNGDRNALSKPLALRAGSTVAMEVVTVRRDGFDGDIRLTLTGLPEGVVAHDLHIPAGKMRGVLLLTASPEAQPALGQATLTARADIAGQSVSHPVRVAQMAWPVADAWNEIPSPRLVDGIPISITRSELAPITISPTSNQMVEVKRGEKLAIPMTHALRSEFSGSVMQLKTFGAGFEGNPPFDVSLTSGNSEAIVNLAAIQPAPGDYKLAFYGTAVAKYRYNPLAITLAESAWKQAGIEANQAAEQLQQATQAASSAPAEKKAEYEQAIAEWTAKKQAAESAVNAAAAKLKAVTEQATPRDTAEIVITEPVTLRVLP